jgi:hypothetical protein
MLYTLHNAFLTYFLTLKTKNIMLMPAFHVKSKCIKVVLGPVKMYLYNSSHIFTVTSVFTVTACYNLCQHHEVCNV